MCAPDGRSVVIFLDQRTPLDAGTYTISMKVRNAAQSGPLDLWGVELVTGEVSGSLVVEFSKGRQGGSLIGPWWVDYSESLVAAVARGFGIGEPWDAGGVEPQLLQRPMAVGLAGPLGAGWVFALVLWV
mmetsp:Transcript_12620/g.28224  ORF Transcript_12620/g.28224 Transcript_12620/m.28224 type:complete len:129 (-) Transcript_12620:42-428(-)